MKVGLVVLGAVLAPALANMNIAFEVDEVEALYARADNTEHAATGSTTDHTDKATHTSESTDSSSESTDSSQKDESTDKNTAKNTGKTTEDSSSDDNTAKTTAKDKNSSEDSSTDTAKDKNTSDDSKNTSDDSKSTSDDSKNTSKETGKDDKTTAKGKGKTTSKVTSTKHTLISVDPRMPQGAVVLVEPTSTSTTYIKSGQNVTFKWTYTNLINSPSGINIEARCSSNLQTYTLARNMSPETKSIVWNTGNTTDDGEHLITAEYTLLMYDSNLSASAVASAGSLGPLNYIFGVYQPQKYVPWPKNDSYVSRALQSGPGVLAVVLGLATIGFVSLM